MNKFQRSDHAGFVLALLAARDVLFVHPGSPGQLGLSDAHLEAKIAEVGRDL